MLAFEPMSLIVPTTRTRITANMTAYSAISWASSSNHNPQKRFVTVRLLPQPEYEGYPWLQSAERDSSPDPRVRILMYFLPCPYGEYEIDTLHLPLGCP